MSNQYIKLYRFAILDDGLSLVEAVILSVLAQYRVCTLHNKTLARVTKCSDRSVTKAISHLEELGYIAVTKGQSAFRKIVISEKIRNRIED